MEARHLLALLQQEIDSKFKAPITATALAPDIQPLEELLAQERLVLCNLLLVQGGGSRQSRRRSQLSGEALRSRLQRTVGGPWAGLVMGMGMTVAMQASSATIMATMGFAAAGLVSLHAAIGIVAGALASTPLFYILFLSDWKPGMSVQAPPNLSPGVLPQLVAAGINDWGGISPVTRDYVNPEAAWPEVERLAALCREHGYELRPRLPVYREWMTPEWVEPSVLLASQVAGSGSGAAQEYLQ